MGERLKGGRGEEGEERIRDAKRMRLEEMSEVGCVVRARGKRSPKGES